MFGRKKQNIPKKEEIKEEKEDKFINESPQICLFDLDESVLEGFEEEF